MRTALVDASGPRGWIFPLRLADQDAIRGAMVSLSRLSVPLSHRMRLMVEISAMLSECPSDFGEVSDSVQSSLIAARSEEACKEFSVRLSKEMRQGGDGVSVIAQLVSFCLAKDSEWGVKKELARRWKQGPVARLGTTESIMSDPDSAWRKYVSHVDALNAVLPGRLDEFSAKFASNYWTRCFWRAGENTLDHTQRLLILLGLVRLVIATDPGLYEARGSGRKVLGALFDETARRVMWACIRAVESDPVLDALVDSLDPCADLNETRSLCQV
jgi:hypothetical protein